MLKGDILYSRKAWQEESLVNCERFAKLKPSKFLLNNYNLLAESIHSPNFFSPNVLRTEFAKLYAHQTFLLYGKRLAEKNMVYL